MSVDRNSDLGLLALRLGLGGTLVAHGAQKLFGAFGGGGLEGTAGAMHAMGFRPGRQNAAVAGVSEAAGGALLALGLATPVGGAVAAAAMSAAVDVHRPNGFFSTSGGFEYPAVLGLASAALAVGGPGRYSLDAVTGNALNRRWIAVTALAAAGAGVAATLRKRQAALAGDARATDPTDHHED